MPGKNCEKGNMISICQGGGGLKKSKIPLMQKIYYGVGHVFNDLCANCWFSYLLLYMTKVVGLSDTNAGLILLIGQIADGLFTPFIGYGCDRTTFQHYGKRKLWHLIGTICVLISFPFVFNLCLGCQDISSTLKVLYYSGFVIVFQFGWAAVQISHLSLIPEIACRVSEKVELNAIRSGLTFVCGIFVFGITWLLLGTNDESKVTPSVSKQFMYLAFIVVGIGSLFSSIFHFGTSEPRPKPNHQSHGKSSILSKCFAKDTNQSIDDALCETGVELNGHANGKVDNQCLLVTIKPSQENEKTWKCWFKTALFYKMALVYMCTRLTLNVSQSYFVLYLTDTLTFEKEAIAYFPLLVLISGVIASIGIKLLAKRIGSKYTFMLGALSAIGACVWFFLLPRGHSKAVYIAAGLMGAGSSVMLVTSLAMTADLIGTNKSSGAFVYSAMSFTDKLSSGIVIAVIQVIKPTPLESIFCIDCASFLRVVQSLVPGVSAFIALVAVGIFFPSDYIWKRRASYQDASTQTSSRSDKNSSDESINEDDEVDACDPTERSIGFSLEVPFDPKLNRLSWHSAMTSYIGSRLASSHLRSPVLWRKHANGKENNPTQV